MNPSSSSSLASETPSVSASASTVGESKEPEPMCMVMLAPQAIISKKLGTQCTLGLGLLVGFCFCFFFFLFADSNAALCVRRQRKDGTWYGISVAHGFEGVGDIALDTV